MIGLTTKVGSVPRSILLRLYKVLSVLGKPLHIKDTRERGSNIWETLRCGRPMNTTAGTRLTGFEATWESQWTLLGESSQRLLRSVFKIQCLNSSLFWNHPSITCSTPMSLLNVYTCSPAGVVLVGNALLDLGNFLGTSSWSKTSWHMQGKIPIFPLVFAIEKTITVWGRLFSIPGYLVIWKIKRLERVNSFLDPEVSLLFLLASLVEPQPTLKVHSSAIALIQAWLFPHRLPVPSLMLLWAMM